MPAAYLGDFNSQQAIDAVVRSTNRTLLVSGGEKAGDAAMLEKARQFMEASHRPDLRPQRVEARALRVAAVRGQLREILPSIDPDGGWPGQGH